jgi:hypothetical protein
LVFSGPAPGVGKVFGTFVNSSTVGSVIEAGGSFVPAVLSELFTTCVVEDGSTRLAFAGSVTVMLMPAKQKMSLMSLATCAGVPARGCGPLNFWKTNRTALNAASFALARSPFLFALSTWSIFDLTELALGPPAEKTWSASAFRAESVVQEPGTIGPATAARAARHSSMARALEGAVLARSEQAAATNNTAAMDARLLAFFIIVFCFGPVERPNKGGLTLLTGKAPEISSKTQGQRSHAPLGSGRECQGTSGLRRAADTPDRS